IMNYRESSTASIGDGIQFRGLGTTTPGQGTIRLAIGSNNSTNGSNDSPLVARPCIGSYHGNKSNSTSFHTFKNNLEYTNPFVSSSTGTVGLYFGGRRDLTTAAGMNGFFTGYISEV